MRLPIVITSNEPWGEVWYSKQNYAFELSKLTTVYFINPPTRWRISNLLDRRIQIESYSPTLHIINYENPLPILNRNFNILNNVWVSSGIRKYLGRLGIEDFIFWSFDPVRLFNPNLLKPSFSIFHCVDYFYFQFPGERVLCEQSDLIFSTSSKFLEQYTEFKTPKYIVPHGISNDEFTISEKELNIHNLDLEDFGLYVGVIDHRLDYILLEQAITKFHNYDFVFIGPIKIPDNEVARRIFSSNIYQNVHVLGTKHFKTLKYYIFQSKFCISFMDPEFHMNTVHHHKTLLYLAQGKPTFGYEYFEYKNLSEIMYMGQSREEILAQLDNFIKEGESGDLAEKRINHALGFTFKKVLNRAMCLIDENR